MCPKFIPSQVDTEIQGNYIRVAKSKQTLDINPTRISNSGKGHIQLPFPSTKQDATAKTLDDNSPFGNIRRGNTREDMFSSFLVTRRENEVISLDLFGFTA